jgi:hypothetical protein
MAFRLIIDDVASAVASFGTRQRMNPWRGA